MDKAALITHISKALGKKQVIDLASNSSGLIKELIELSLVKETEIAFRAAWVLELVAFDHFEHFKNLIKEFTSAYLMQKNESCQRHYTKIMMFLTDKKQEKGLLQDIDLEPVVDITFEWLINPETPVAVQCNCMDILYNLREPYGWIREELPEQVQFLMRNGSAALQSRGKKVLAKFSRKRAH